MRILALDDRPPNRGLRRIGTSGTIFFMYTTDFWNDPIHRRFVERLNQPQLQALWELLIIATFADQDLTVEERRGLADAMKDLPDFENVTIDEGSDELERLYAAFEADPDQLLGDLSTRLGGDLTRRGAFRTAVQLIKSDGLNEGDREFVRKLGALLDLEHEVIDFALSGTP